MKNSGFKVDNKSANSSRCFHSAIVLDDCIIISPKFSYKFSLQVFITRSRACVTSQCEFVKSLPRGSIKTDDCLFREDILEPVAEQNDN